MRLLLADVVWMQAEQTDFYAVLDQKGYLD